MDRDWPGSSWWRVDFHAHSPGSYDFRAAGGSRPSWRAWVSAAVAAGIDAVVVVDHNTGAYVDDIKAARVTLGLSLTIFPGVELTASDGSHLLFILDPDCSGEHVDELLALARVPVDQRNLDTARSRLSVEDLLGLRPSREAIVIAAHANKSDGILGHGGQQRLQELRHEHLAAVEIVPDSPVDRTWIDGSKPETGVVPWVYGSDAHELTELGRRFTWVKMTTPTLDGLRLALLDGQDSLRPVQAGDSVDPNRHAAATIESITVAHTKHMGMPEQFVLRFNPWLNAIIGGRGTGKSTLVDLGRLVLRREVDLGISGEGSVRQAFAQRMHTPASRGDQGLLRPETNVSLVYRKDDQRYRLSWNTAGTIAPIVHLGDGAEASEGGDIRERFPVRIYSQKQLFEMAQNPSVLLDVIDESPDVDGAEARRRLREAETRYLSIRADGRSLRSQAASLADKQANLLDVQRRIQVLSTGGQAEAFSRYATRSRQDREWTAIVTAMRETVRELREAAARVAVPDLDLRTDPEADAPARAVTDARSLLEGVMAAFSAEVSAATDRALAQIDALASAPQTVEWSAEIVAVTRAYEQAAEQLAAAGIDDPRQYGHLLQQSAAIESELAALSGRQEAAAQRDTEAIAELERYRATFAARDRSRAAFCGARGTEQLQLSVKVADRERLIESLAETIHATLGIERFEADVRGIAERIAGTANQAWSFARLDAAITRLETAARGQGTWADQRFESALARVTPERLDRLRLIFPEQTVDVRRRDRDSWLPISQGSPGQQTAALLAFVLSYGDEPIILDQPEDDLDSTLIYDLVVRELRKSKERRQVIVVTHNANIVVHGDAEAITVLEARDDQTRLAFQGGLQESSARQRICEVLEGGAVAFKERYRRITEGTRGA